MVKVSRLLFGYRVLTMQPDHLGVVCVLLMHKGIATEQIDDCRIAFSEWDTENVKKLLDKSFDYSISDSRGFYGFIKRIKFKRGLLAGAFLSLLLCIFLQNIVWDLRVDGNDKLSETSILKTLNECGFCIGRFWNGTNLTEVEGDVLRYDDRIAWININRRGTVAYVEIVEKEFFDESKFKNNNSGYSNLVSKESCVIEEITVKCGTAMVKVGDVVKEGDLLISGINANGDFCYADGEVVGRVSRRIDAKVDRIYEKAVLSEHIPIEYTVKIFNFPINIFKNYRNLYSECDIIEDVNLFSVFDYAPLPIGVVKKYALKEVCEMAEYSDDELVLHAFRILSAKSVSAFSKSDVLKIKTYGEYTESGYIMYTDAVVLTDVGKNIEFFVD